MAKIKYVITGETKTATVTFDSLQKFLEFRRSLREKVKTNETERSQK